MIKKTHVAFIMGGLTVAAVTLPAIGYQRMLLHHNRGAIRVFKDSTATLLETAPLETLRKLENDLDFWEVATQI